jgi:hypothetical protein
MFLEEYIYLIPHGLLKMQLPDVTIEDGPKRIR